MTAPQPEEPMLLERLQADFAPTLRSMSAAELGVCEVMHFGGRQALEELAARGAGLGATLEALRIAGLVLELVNAEQRRRGLEPVSPGLRPAH